MTATPKESRWDLCLFVSGKDGPKSQLAYANIVRICEEHLSAEYQLTVVDVLQVPEAVALEQLLALPTLVRRSPKPVRRIIGDLTDANRILVSLGVKAIDTFPAVDA